MSIAPRLIQVGTILRVDDEHGRRYGGTIVFQPIEPFERIKSKLVKHGLNEQCPCYAQGGDLLEILEVKTYKKKYPNQPAEEYTDIRVKFVVDNFIHLRRINYNVYVVGIAEEFWVSYDNIKRNCSFAG